LSTLELILAMAVGVYALRLSGLLLAGAKLPSTWERALGFVPIATLTALVVSSLTSRPDEGLPRLVAAAAAGLAARGSGRAWICIGIGMAIYWLLRLV
jgi:branched-subunit amino acid transport protein